ncbi:hypothetical protein HY30_08905 [Hyphomonas chukchiensis]|uniref:Uncharacterized protein n=1 Tax=Hyphomonas chukchiensis TaxID=1280947 RepID=A0A062UAE5_9PROT|nr:hypothetical protein HY30_08905 [Hyphomonas chukchiensis]
MLLRDSYVTIVTGMTDDRTSLAPTGLIGHIWDHETAH